MLGKERGRMCGKEGARMCGKEEGRLCGKEGGRRCGNFPTPIFVAIMRVFILVTRHISNMR